MKDDERKRVAQKLSFKTIDRLKVGDVVLRASPHKLGGFISACPIREVYSYGPDEEDLRGLGKDGVFVLSFATDHGFHMELRSSYRGQLFACVEKHR